MLVVTRTNFGEGYYLLLEAHYFVISAILSSHCDNLNLNFFVLINFISN